MTRVGGALPVVRSLEDCVDLERTVYSLSHQFWGLSSKLLDTKLSPHALLALYKATNPLISGFAWSLFLAPIFLIAAEVNGNYSQVDRVWSVLPVMYNLHYFAFAHLTGQSTQRTDLAFAVSLVWGSRLTYNYYRRGGYSIGSEDYRWKIVKDYIGQPLFFVLDVLFISLAQSILLFSITTPSYVLLLSSKVAPSILPADTVFAASIVSIIGLTGVADQQQWNYHAAKVEYQETAKVPEGWAQADLDLGFNTTGLFRYSRHPNYAAEQAVWITFFLWSCEIAQTYRNWTAVGPALYLILFQASTWLTELLTSRKYSQYEEYQRQVGMFVPSPFSTWTAKESKKEPKEAENGPKTIDLRKKKKG